MINSGIWKEKGLGVIKILISNNGLVLLYLLLLMLKYIVEKKK